LSQNFNNQQLSILKILAIKRHNFNGTCDYSLQQHSNTVIWRTVITGLPTNSVGGQYYFARWRLSSVTLHGGPVGGFTHRGQAMTS